MSAGDDEAAPLELLLALQQTLQAINGYTLVANHIRQQSDDTFFASPNFNLLAVGKAAVAMAAGAAEILGKRIQRGLVISKRDHRTHPLLEQVQYLEAGHPLPDEASLQAGRSALDFVHDIESGQPLLCLISGGGSALVECLPDDITLEDLQHVTQWLLANGSTIHEINTVRGALSRVKHGKLLSHVPADCSVRVLYISDVQGDALDVIASGLMCDTNNAPAGEAVNAQFPMQTSALQSELPNAVLSRIQNPASQENAWPHRNDIKHSVLMNNQQARNILAKKLEQQDYSVEVYEQGLFADIERHADEIASVLLNSRPGQAHVWGGEPIVRLPESAGRGGRNQHLALLLAQRLQSQPQRIFLAFGTDGTDGNTEDAGAWVDGNVVEQAGIRDFDVDQELSHANSGDVLEATGSLIHTGATGTNVMDLMVGLVLCNG